MSLKDAKDKQHMAATREGLNVGANSDGHFPKRENLYDVRFFLTPPSLTGIVSSC